jgi:hypothetical protein
MRQVTELYINAADELRGRQDAWYEDVISRIVLFVAALLGRWVGLAFDRMAKETVGVVTPFDTGIEGEIAQARAENLALLDKAARNYANAVRGVFSDPEVFGLRVEEIRRKLQERADLSIRHADLIARDQVLKLNAAITRIRQTNAGITKYTWSTS